MVIGALAAAMIAKIKDNGSELRINEKLRTTRADEMGDWCKAQTPEISDEEETSEPPRDERNWEKEIQTEVLLERGLSN